MAAAALLPPLIDTTSRLAPDGVEEAPLGPAQAALDGAGGMKWWMDMREKAALVRGTKGMATKVPLPEGMESRPPPAVAEPDMTVPVGLRVQDVPIPTTLKEAWGHPVYGPYWRAATDR